jgi:hypothetical protein
MAIYHLHAKMVQRNKDQSAVAAAERWASRRRNLTTPEQGAERMNTPTPQYPDLELKRTRDHRREGPKDDLEL